MTSWCRRTPAVLALCLALGTAAPGSGVQPVSLERLASRIADDVQRHGAEAPVGVWVRSEAQDLAQAFATLLSSELAKRKLAPVAIDAPSAAQAEDAARAQGTRALVRLNLSLENGLLQVRGDLVGTWVNFWSGATATRPAAPAAGLEASTEADAHALALAAANLAQTPVTGQPQTGEVKLLGGVFARLGKWTSAIAAGDLDGDGKDEVLALTEDELLAFSPDGRLLARRDLRALPPAATPSREPFGALSVLQNPARAVWVSGQKARGEQVALEGRAGFRVLGPAEDASLGNAGTADVTAKLMPGLNTFAPQLTLSTGATLPAPAPFCTSSLFVGPGGAELLLVQPNGNAQWRSGTAPDGATLEFKELGAGSALADVDGDGTAELVTTEASFSPEPDALKILRGPSAGAAATDPLRFRKELPRGRALQVVAARLDPDAAQELIVAVWMPDGTTELQVFRRAR